jgi:hypothetical protein
MVLRRFPDIVFSAFISRDASSLPVTLSCRVRSPAAMSSASFSETLIGSTMLRVRAMASTTVRSDAAMTTVSNTLTLWL